MTISIYIFLLHRPSKNVLSTCIFSLPVPRSTGKYLKCITRDNTGTTPVRTGVITVSTPWRQVAYLCCQVATPGQKQIKTDTGNNFNQRSHLLLDLNDVGCRIVDSKYIPQHTSDFQFRFTNIFNLNLTRKLIKSDKSFLISTNF